MEAVSERHYSNSIQKVMNQGIFIGWEYYVGGLNDGMSLLGLTVPGFVDG